jgi:hypothetical protein
MKCGFFSQTIGDSKQIKGYNARRFTIKLAKFIHKLNASG